MKIRVIDRASRAVVYEGAPEGYTSLLPPRLDEPIPSTPPPIHDVIAIFDRGVFVEAGELHSLTDRTDFTVDTGDVEDMVLALREAGIMPDGEVVVGDNRHLIWHRVLTEAERNQIEITIYELEHPDPPVA